MDWFLNAILAVYANDWLAGRASSAEVRDVRILEDAPAFASFRSLKFGTGQGFLEWLIALRQSGAKRVWVHRPTTAAPAGGLPAYQAAAFAGGIQVGLLVTGDAPTALWVCKLEPAETIEQARRSPRPWQLTFTEYPLPQATQDDRSLAEASSVLSTVLAEISGFAAEQHLDNWQTIFAAAADRLRGNADETLNEVRADFWAEVLGIEALRLLAACRNAWVFGGMGSWNDQGFQNETDQARYEELSAALYDAVSSGVCAVANTAGR